MAVYLQSQLGRLLEIDSPLLFEILLSLVVWKMWWFGNGNVKGRGLKCLIKRSILAPAVYGCLCDMEGKESEDLSRPSFCGGPSLNSVSECD